MHSVQKKNGMLFTGRVCVENLEGIRLRIAKKRKRLVSLFTTFVGKSISHLSWLSLQRMTC